MNRPVVDDATFDHMTRRQVVWYRRRVAAWDLASKLGEVTEESYEQAWRLLDSCKNVALGFVRCDEQESEFNWKRVEAKRTSLIARMDGLNERLRPYGCKMHRISCCENVYEWDFERRVPLNDHGYCYFF